jgi:CHAD domain-containing protein
MRGTTKAFAVAVARRGAIDPADPVTIHRTRVAFKRFRYMVECLSPAFTGLGKRALRPLAIYQRRMGLLQDLEIMRNCLERFSKDHEGTEDLLRPFCRQLQRRRTRSLRRFLRSADHLLHFWPPRNRASVQTGA